MAITTDRKARDRAGTGIQFPTRRPNNGGSPGRGRFWVKTNGMSRWQERYRQTQGFESLERTHLLVVAALAQACPRRSPTNPPLIGAHMGKRRRRSAAERITARKTRVVEELARRSAFERERLEWWERLTRKRAA